MVASKDGHLFTGRYDCNDPRLQNFGVLESYKILFKGDLAIVDLVCCVGLDGLPIVPAFIEGNTFKPLYMRSNNVGEAFDEDIRKFVKGNKPIFGKLGSFALIGVFTLKFNRHTLQLNEEKSSFKFYAPNRVVNKMSEHSTSTPPIAERDEPALLCNEVAPSEGFKMFYMDKAIIDAYAQKCKSVLTGDICMSRADYVIARAKMKSGE